MSFLVHGAGGVRPHAEASADLPPGAGGAAPHIHTEHGVHGFRNDADEPASFLVLFAPGHAREAFYRELAEVSASGRQLSDAELADLYHRHDQYTVDVDGGPEPGG